MNFSAKYIDWFHSLVLNVLFTRALGEHLPPSIIPSCANPGFCHSELRRNLPLSNWLRLGLLDIVFGRSAEHGARQILWAALGPDGQDGEHLAYLRGAYVSMAEVCPPSDFAMSKQGYETQERIWVRARTITLALE